MDQACIHQPRHPSSKRAICGERVVRGSKYCRKHQINDPDSIEALVTRKREILSRCAKLEAQRTSIDVELQQFKKELNEIEEMMNSDKKLGHGSNEASSSQPSSSQPSSRNVRMLPKHSAPLPGAFISPDVDMDDNVHVPMVDSMEEPMIDPMEEPIEDQYETKVNQIWSGVTTLQMMYGAAEKHLQMLNDKMKKDYDLRNLRVTPYRVVQRENIPTALQEKYNEIHAEFRANNEELDLSLNYLYNTGLSLLRIFHADTKEEEESLTRKCKRNVLEVMGYMHMWLRESYQPQRKTLEYHNTPSVEDLS